MQSKIRDIIENLQTKQEWQESKTESKIIGNKRYQTQESRIELFRQICDYHSKNGKFIINDKSKPIVNNLFHYCNLQKGEYDILKGLYIHGPVGSGKSTLMKIVRDYSRELYPPNTLNNVRVKRADEMQLLDQISLFQGGFRIVNTTQVSNNYKLEQKGENRLETFFSNNEICFDEFGREPIPVMNYGTSLNVMQYILEIRYDNWNTASSLYDKLNTRTHITTNILTGSGEEVDISELCEIYQPHIADRLREMCNIIHLDEKSFRRF